MRSSSKARRRHGDGPPISLNLARIVHRLMTDPRGWRLDRMEAELGVGPSARKKYIRRLRDEFVPFSGVEGSPRVQVVRDEDGAYLRLQGAADIAPETDQGLATIAAMHLVSRLVSYLDGTALAEAVERVCREVRERTKDSTFAYRELLADLDRKLYCAPDAEKDYLGHDDAVRAIMRALVFRRPVTFDYRSASTGEVRRVALHPLTLLAARGSLYVAGREFPRLDVTKFEVLRIEGDVLVDRTRQFTYPAAGDYDPSSLVEGSFGVYTESGPARDVRVVFEDEPWLRRMLEERRWHPSQQLRRLAGGRVELTMRVRSLVGVGNWLYGLEDWIVEVEPSREQFGRRRRSRESARGLAARAERLDDDA